MSNLSNRDVGLAQNMFESSSTQKHQLGTRGVMGDGRVFRYVKAGAVDLIAGTVVQSPVVTAGHQSLTPNTTSQLSIGGSALSLTCASTVVANFYAEGYAIISTSTGAGFQYQLDNHAAVSTGATGLFPFYLPQDGNTLVTAITVTSLVTLVPNKHNGVVIVPATTATGLVVGVATYVITAAQFGWVQTWGQVALLSNDASAMGQWLNGIAATCGRAAFMSSPAVTACAIVGQFIGHIYQTGVQGQWVAADLRISP
jgi:hypothetical protein